MLQGTYIAEKAGEIGKLHPFLIVGLFLDLLVQLGQADC